MHYQNYVWKQGLPYGVKPVEECQNLTFKIVMDPYRKRISIEKYSQGQFEGMIYDSALLDFRHLAPLQQNAWERLPTADLSITWIRNQDDRIILKEVCQFEQDLCRECKIYSPQGIFLSVHKMSYKILGDPFNGVILYDSNNHAVMSKKYEFDANLREFTTLLEQNWDPTNIAKDEPTR